MELPKLTVPVYEVTLPSNGKKVRIRPFLVKEEKLLLMAAQSKDTNEVINTVKQIITNCLIDNDVNVDTLPFFDVDFLFIALRAKSIGESVEVVFTCNAVLPDTEDQRCGSHFNVDIDISKAGVDNKNLDSKIMISDTVGVQMKYPKYSVVKAIMSGDESLDKTMKIIQASIDYIFDEKGVYSSKDYSKEDFEAFFDGLTRSQLELLEEWVNNYPTFYVDAKAKCKKCGFDHKLRYKDFTSFFF